MWECTRDRGWADRCRIIEYINRHEGVEWMTFGDMAKEFLEGRIDGVSIEGGADVDVA